MHFLWLPGRPEEWVLWSDATLLGVAAVQGAGLQALVEQSAEVAVPPVVLPPAHRQARAAEGDGDAATCSCSEVRLHSQTAVRNLMIRLRFYTHLADAWLPVHFELNSTRPTEHDCCPCAGGWFDAGAPFVLGHAKGGFAAAAKYPCRWLFHAPSS